MGLRKTIFGRKNCNFKGLGYDDSLEDILKRACELKYILPNEAQKLILNQLIVDLKLNGLWDKQDYILNFAYNDTALSNFSLINLKKPKSSLATIKGGMAFTVNGWKGNGLNGSIETPFNPTLMGVNYKLNNAGRGGIVYVDGIMTPAYRLLDYNASGYSRITNLNATQHRINSSGTSLSSAINLSGIGYKGIFRNSSSNIELYNKTAKYSVVSNSTIIDNNIFRLISQGTVNWGDIGMSFYHIGSYLTQTEIENLRAIYNNYLSRINLLAIS
jgi:hypothetical protein